MSELIQAVAVERDGNGEWWHPGIPDFAESVEAYVGWLAAQGLESQHVLLSQEWDNWAGGESCLGWEPRRPDGDGWFVICIACPDDGEGPCCWWVRRPAPAEVH